MSSVPRGGVRQAVHEKAYPTPPPPKPVDVLPSDARLRLVGIQAEKDAALDAANSALKRVNELRRVLSYNPQTPEHEVEQLQLEIDRLEQQRIAANDRHVALANLLARINEFVAQQRGRPLKSAKPLPVPNGATLEKTRDAISKCSAEISRLKKLPMTKAELKDGAAKFIARQASRCKVVVQSDASGAVIVRFDDSMIANTPTEPMNVVAWAMKEMLTAKVAVAIDAQKISDDAMPTADKIAALEQQRGKLAELERCEEALIRAEERETGRMPLRRANVDPAIILGVSSPA